MRVHSRLGRAALLERHCRALAPGAVEHQHLARWIGQLRGAKIGQRHVERAGDVPGGEFIGFAHIDHQRGAAVEHRGELIGVHFLVPGLTKTEYGRFLSWVGRLAVLHICTCLYDNSGILVNSNVVTRFGPPRSAMPPPICMAEHCAAIPTCPSEPGRDRRYRRGQRQSGNHANV